VVEFIIPIITSSNGLSSFCSGSAIDRTSSTGDSYQWS